MAYAVFATQNTQTAQLAIPLFVYLATQNTLLKMDHVTFAFQDLLNASHAIRQHVLLAWQDILFRMGLVRFATQAIHIVKNVTQLRVHYVLTITSLKTTLATLVRADSLDAIFVILLLALLVILDTS